MNLILVTSESNSKIMLLIKNLVTLEIAYKLNSNSGKISSESPHHSPLQCFCKIQVRNKGIFYLCRENSLHHPSSLPREGYTPETLVHPGDIGITPTEFSSIKSLVKIFKLRHPSSLCEPYWTPINQHHPDLTWVGCTPIGNFTPDYHPDQIFYLLYAEVHLIREHGQPSNLIPPSLSPARRGAPRAVFGPRLGQWWRVLCYLC